MSEPKIIAVVGATGAQGGGLVRAIQSDPRGGFRARAITRDPNSPKARELAAAAQAMFGSDADHTEMAKLCERLAGR